MRRSNPLLNTAFASLFLSLAAYSLTDDPFVWEMEDRLSWRDDYDLRGLPLDPERVGKADELFYTSLSPEEEGELQDRPLTMGSGDAEYRHRWMNLYMSTVVGRPIPRDEAIESVEFPIPTAVVPLWADLAASGIMYAGGKAMDALREEPQPGPQEKLDRALIERHIAELKGRKAAQDASVRIDSSGKGSSTNQDALAKATEEYQNAKNASGDEVAKQSSLGSERQSYDNRNKAKDDSIRQDKARIEEQKKEKNRLENKLAALKGKIEATKGKIASLRLDKARLENEMSAAQKLLEETQASNAAAKQAARQEVQRVSQEVERVNGEIVEQEENLDEMEEEETSTADSLSTVIGLINLGGSAMSLMNSISPSASSERSQVYEDTQSYSDNSSASSKAPSSGRRQASDTVRRANDVDPMADARRQSEQDQAYVNQKMKERYGGSDIHWKQTEYRKNTPSITQ